MQRLACPPSRESRLSIRTRLRRLALLQTRRPVRGWEEGNDLRRLQSIIPSAELESLRTGLSEEQYAEEFECSFDAAVVGANYGKLMRAAEDSGRITGRRPLRNIT